MLSLFLFVATLSTSGCLTPQDYTPLAQYTIEPNLTEIPKTATTETTLGIRRFSAAQPLKRDIFYRDPDLRVGNLLDAQWAESPPDMMTRHVFDAATSSDHFQDVGLAIDVSRPTYVLTGDVRRFDLNRTQEQWRADCEVHFELRRVRDGGAAWSDTLSGSEQLSENTVATLPKAMSEAAAQVIREAIIEIVKSSPEL